MITSNLFLTVFTPSYNRANYLHRAYHSLVSQTYKHFEWIIIDDGSTDNTGDIVQAFMQEGKLNMQYHYQENGGKHSAFNRAIQLAKGSFFIVIDSDDAVKTNAFETLIKYWMEIPDADKQHFIGVTGLCQNQHGNLVGDRYPYSPFDSTPTESYFKHKIKGDKFGMMRTDILSQYRFPELKASFYPEAFLWFTIGKKYKTRYINEFLLINYIEAKESLSKLGHLSRENAVVLSDYYLFLINDFFKYCRYMPVSFIKYFVLYTSYAGYSGKKFLPILQQIKNPFTKVIGAVLYPVSIYYRNRAHLK